tara:strand:- start:49 stop:183 length:135 start_codon:yes stop_codon:yes gene_type:complete
MVAKMADKREISIVPLDSALETNNGRFERAMNLIDKEKDMAKVI